MIDKLPVIQRFLLFLIKNVSAILIILLGSSIAGNVYLYRQYLLISLQSDAFKTSTIEYERLRGQKLEEILHQEIKRETMTKRKPNE